MSNEPGDNDQPHDDLGTTNPVYAAVARSLTRGAALYFSRPIRLFRPSKSKHLHIQQPTFFFFWLSGPTCKQSQRLAIPKESRCQRWDVIESRFCLGAREIAGGASREFPPNTPLQLISPSSDTSNWKALSSTTHCEYFIGHCPMGDLLGDVLSVEQS
jgi:hypothetical protein